MKIKGIKPPEELQAYWAGFTCMQKDGVDFSHACRGLANSQSLNKGEKRGFFRWIMADVVGVISLEHFCSPTWTSKKIMDKLNNDEIEALIELEMSCYGKSIVELVMRYHTDISAEEVTKLVTGVYKILNQFCIDCTIDVSNEPGSGWVMDVYVDDRFNGHPITFYDEYQIDPDTKPEDIAKITVNQIIETICEIERKKNERR